MDDLEQRIQQLEERLNILDANGLFVMPKLMKFNEGINIQVGKTTGTMIGTEATQKIGFFGHAPVPQSVLNFNVQAGSTYTSVEQNILNGLQNELIKYGLLIT